MWIFTPTAFVSAVAHRTKPDCLLVRARLKGDLQRLFPGCVVQTTPNADYRFRAAIPRAAFAAVLSNLVAELAYPNVKDAIPHGAKVHDLRHSAMNRVWSVMHSAQLENAGGRAMGGDSLLAPSE